MDTHWQVVIGSAVGGALVSLFLFYKEYLAESKEDHESQTLATVSILLGLSGILTMGVGSLAGVLLAIFSMSGKKNKALSKIGIVVSVLTLIPWLLVFILGP